MRLDHLLSKEHHDVWAGPQIADYPVSQTDSLDGPVSVVDRVLVHNKQSNQDGVFPWCCQTHCWALRQQTRWFCAVGCGGIVVALLWWWGVVFDLWIVVASI